MKNQKKDIKELLLLRENIYNTIKNESLLYELIEGIDNKLINCYWFDDIQEVIYELKKEGKYNES